MFVLPFRRALTLWSGMLLLCVVHADLFASTGPAGCSITFRQPLYTSSEFCPGAADGAVSAQADCDACASELEYSLNGTDYQSSSYFPGLAPGSYTITARDAGNTSCFVQENFEIGAGSDTIAPVLTTYTTLRWQHKQKFQTAEGNTLDRFGSSVDVDGDYAVVGAPADDEGGADAGAVYIYVFGENGWVQEAKLLAPEPTAGDEFGSTVSISGDYVLVGAQNNDAAGQNAGTAYVYLRQGISWSVQTAIQPADLSAEDRFGASLSLSGDYAIVGAYGADDNGDGAGAAYVFTRSGSSWTQQAKLQSSDIVAGDEFGFDVDVKDDRAIIGAPGKDDGFARGAGAAYIFLRDGAAWQEQSKLLAVGGQLDDRFGHSVAIDGTLAVAGAPNEGSGGARDRGAAYTFKYKLGAWKELAFLKDFDGNDSANMGSSVAVEGSTVVVGAPGRDANGLSSTGAIYLYKMGYSEYSVLGQRLAPGGAADDLFGTSVAITDGKILVGSTLGGGENPDAGAVFYLDQERYLPDATVAYCGSPATAVAPTANDRCAGTVTGTTNDATTFSGPGTDTIRWSFEDDNGNTTAVKQLVEVVDRTVTITSVETTPVSCPGGSDGAITVEATCVDCPGGLEYSLDGANFQSSTTFTGLAAGDYTLTVREVGGATCSEEATFTVAAGVDGEAPSLPLGWGQTAKVRASDGARFDQFGGSVAISENWAVVGASSHDEGGTNVGAAYVFELLGTAEWVQRAKLRGSDTQSNNQFGSSVAISGNVIIVGAPGHDFSTGAAYVFERDADDSWVQTAKLQSNARNRYDNFGYSVAVSDGRIVVGAYGDDTGSIGAGAAYVFSRADNGSWEQVAKLQATERAENSLFGYEVAIDGDRLLSSANFKTATGASIGTTYVFERTSDNNWLQTAKLQTADQTEGDQFGSSIAVSGDYIVAGAYTERFEGEWTGAAYVFEHSPTNGWTQVAKLQSSDKKRFDRFGNDVAISGDRLVVGDNGKDEGGRDAGAAYVFERTDAGGWVQTFKLWSSDKDTYDSFGNSVAISDNRIFVGAVGEERQGAAYYFEPAPTLSPSTIAFCSDPVTATPPTAEDNCGGTIIATTTGITTFTAAGTYSVDWTFDDFNGNATVFSQTIEVLTPAIVISSVEATDEICSDDGIIVVDAFCSYCPESLEYSVDGVNFVADDTIRNLSAGNYTVAVRQVNTTCVSTAAEVTIKKEMEAPVIQSLVRKQIATLQEENMSANNGYGNRIAVSHNRAIISDASNGGYILNYEAGKWVQTATIRPSIDLALDTDDLPVAIHGDFAVIGTPKEDGNGVDEGAVYVFHKADDVWTETQRLSSPDLQSPGFFGQAVTMDENYLFVGAPGDDNSSDDGGIVYVYKRDGTNWTYQSYLYSENSFPDNSFGSSISVDGDKVVVGGKLKGQASTSDETGEIYVFTLDTNSGQWVDPYTWLYATDGQPGDRLGGSVDISGDYIIAGAEFADAGGNNAGAAYIFGYTENGWVQTAKLQASNGAAGFHFGTSVAIEGNVAYVGTRDNSSGSPSPKAVYRFERTDTGWAETEIIPLPTSQNAGNFGGSMALEGNHLLIGASGQYTSGATGAVFAFNTMLPSDTLAYCGSSITANPPTATDNCAGTVTGTTDDPTTFDTVGTYIIDWTFDDGNGNVTTAEQVIEVVDRTVTITSLQTTLVSCPGESDGTITVEAICDDCSGSLEYSIDGANFQAANTFTDLAPGDYTLTIQEAGSMMCFEEAAFTVRAGVDDEPPVPVDANYSWEQASKALMSDRVGGDQAGNAVAISENYAIVGARFNGTGGANSQAGGAYIFQLTPTGWVEQVKLEASDAQPSDQFGQSVAISDNYAVVGAYAEDEGGSAAGAVYVFERSGGGWVQQAKLTASDTEAEDVFGYSVALHENTIIVGAYGEDTGGATAGAAYIFERSGSNWIEQAKLTATDAEADDRFGHSVSIYNNLALVGALREDVAGFNSGAVYLFKRPGTDWTQTDKFTGSDTDEGDAFGSSIGMSENFAIIGAGTANGNTGAAYIFEYTGNEFSEKAKFVASNPVNNGQFGASVAISSRYAIAGSPVFNGTGSAQIFARTDAGWEQQADIAGSDYSGNAFGRGVAISNGHALVGSPGDNEAGSFAGAAHFFVPSVTLPQVSLAFCGTPVTAPTVTATDDCAGTVMGTTTDPTTFNAEGTYSIDWTFDDGNGNVTVANQTVQVYDIQVDITSVVSTPQSCFGEADGTLTVTAACSTCPDGVQYSIDGLNYQSGNVFTGLAAAEYTIYVREPNSLCVSTATTTLDESEDTEAPIPAVPAISGWAQAYKALMDNGGANDAAGESVDIEGDYAVVGAIYNAENEVKGGAAYVFKRNGSQWVEEAVLLASDRQENDKFGVSVAISGDYIVVGADRVFGTSNMVPGAAYVFKRNGTVWTEQAKLTAGDTSGRDYFGATVSIDGDVIAIGADEEDSQGTNSGAVYVFNRDGENWTLNQKLKASDASANDKFGVRISLSGDYLAIGAVWEDTGGSDAGAAYVFHRSEGNWTQQAKLAAANPASQDYFGIDVGISGDQLIVGAYNKLVNGNRPGAAYIFERTGTTWTRTAELVGSDVDDNDLYALTVDITKDHAIVGAASQYLPGENRGTAYTYSKNENGWGNETKIISLDPLNSNALGRSVAISGPYVVLGATGDDDRATNAGAAYFFQPKLATDTLLYCISPVTAPMATATDNCAGTVTGTTADATTFTAPGTYTIEWSFDDGNGNTTIADQTIEVLEVTVTAYTISTNETCPGENDGTITIEADCTNCPDGLEYGFDETGYQSSNTFTNLAAGRYLTSARARNANCAVTLIVDVGSSNSAPVPDQVDSEGWQAAHQLLAGDGTEEDDFASSIAIHGNVAVVGAPTADINGFDRAGAAYVFQKNTDGEWEQLQKIAAPTQHQQNLALFGYAVDVSRDYMAIGAYSENAGGRSLAGEVHIYRRSGLTWKYHSRLQPAIPGGYEYFGFSLALDGNSLIVGAPLATASGVIQAGTARVYTLQGGEWIKEADLFADTPLSNAQFGYVVDIDGDKAIISARSEPSASISYAGAAYIFERTETAWTQTAKLTTPNPERNDFFGDDVAIQGDFAVVGFSSDTVKAAFNAGSAYLFENESNTGNWVLAQRLTAAVTDGGSQFGRRLDVHDSTIVIGAYTGDNGGSVHEFNYNSSVGKWTESNKLMNPSSEWAGFRFGSDVAIDGGTIIVGADASSRGTASAHIFDKSFQLTPDTLNYCGIPVTVPTPTATDDCAGTVMGTTTDATTFTATGTYTITWAFDDGNGNVTTAEQSITVLGAVLPLPIVEGFEETSLTRDCWTINDVNNDGSWYYERDNDSANSGRYAAVLNINYDRAQDDQLISPAFAATPGVWYNLSFHFVRAWTLTGHLRVVLLDADDNSEVKQLFYSKDKVGWFVKSTLLFDVPSTGTYRIAFESDTPTGGSDLRLDDIEISAFTLPTDGAAALVDPSDDACDTYRGYGMNGYAWTRYMSRDGSLLIEMDANGNDLGDVVLEMVDHSGVPLTPYLGQRQLSRHFNITPANGPGPYTVNGGVKIRLYYTAQELLDYNDFLSESNGWDDLIVSHYSGVNQDCSLENSTDPEYTFELLTNEGDFGGTAHYLEFTTQSFSEFSATTDQAAPVVLTEFTAREDGPVNRLDWTVASEIDFSHYEVQRSTTGTDFVALAEVAGRNLTDYASSDPAPAPLTYYRLKMVDYDGTYAYSKIVSVQRAAAAPATFRLLGAFPVPTSTGVTLHYEALEAGELELRITNSLGRLVRQQMITASSGRNEQPIDLSGLPAATYQIVLLEGGDVHTLRVIKQ